MKKILFTIVFIGFYFNAISQIHSIGILGGVNFSKISEKEFPFHYNISSRTGLNSGLKYEYWLSDTYLIGADLLYNQQGYSCNLNYSVIGDGEPLFEDLRVNQNYNYLSLPIKFGISFNSYPFRIIPKIGIQTSYLLNAKSVWVNDNEIYDLKRSSNKFDVSGLFELEFDYNMISSTDIFVQVSGKYGFTPFLKYESVKHTSLMISIGFKHSLISNHQE